jgi:UDP-glucose 4-epimerase
LRVLVTGASGFVGGAMVERLAAEGHRVVALTRRADGPPAGVERVVADLAAHPEHDLVPTGVEACEAIVHAAAAITYDPHAPELSLVNCLGTQRVVALAERWGVRSLIYISSVPVIGTPRRLPVDEDHPVDPPTAYHASKLHGERLVELARGRGLSAATLRLTAPVGPGMPDGRILSVWVRRALGGEPLELAGDGGRRQDYVDVRDVAAGVAACLRSEAAGLFNVASGRAVSNRELADLVLAECGSSSSVGPTGRPDPDEHVSWEVSIERAAAAFGYAPQHDLRDSIAAVAAELRGET